MTPKDIEGTFAEWPQSWMGMEVDLPYGQAIVDEFRPFVLSLIEAGLSRKTIRAHIDSLWYLGGEIIREVSLYEEYDVPARESLMKNIGDDGGPYCRHIHTATAQREFDATCRKLYKFMKAERGRTPRFNAHFAS